MKAMNSLFLMVSLTTLGLGCEDVSETDQGPTMSIYDDSWSAEDYGEEYGEEEYAEEREEFTPVAEESSMCNGQFISAEAVDEMILLTELTDHEDVYSTYERIDEIAALFEACGDPWGLFPTTYRHITRRIIQALERREIEDTAWGKAIVLDFAARYLESLQAVLKGEEPSYAWGHYYYLADQEDVSRTRAVLVAMVAHLTLDLPYALVAIDTVEDQEDDYFELGELMIEITPDFLEDLRFYYDTDAEDVLNGFFFGDWIDGVYGQDTTITLSYQTIRTKSWNNRWLLEQWWGGWVAESEIYTAFWTIDGVLASLDAAGTI
jgi:hypothetical protein